MKIVVHKREVVQKKVKQLFNEGQIPAVVYGPKRKSLNIAVDRSEFEKVFHKAGHSEMIDFEVEGEKIKGKVLIREVQNNPVTDGIIHVAFYELDLSKEITTEVPLEFIGTSPALEQKIGFLMTPIEEVEVRCLPEKLPSEIKVDVSKLAAIGDSILVHDLLLPEGVELTVEVSEHTAVAFIAPPQKEIVEEVKVVEEEEAEEGAEGEEGEAIEGEEGEAVEGEEEKEEVLRQAQDKKKTEK
jgi:large subunit ribosomal protein L25